MPLEQFYKDKTSKTGLTGRCKFCAKQYHKQWHQDNSECQKQYHKQLRSSIEPGVYMIKCLVNGSCYIGQSKEPYNRRGKHFSVHKSSKKIPTSPKLQQDLKQLGKNAFVFGVIEHCNESQLLEREQYYITQYQPAYNIYKQA